jgi:ribose/xylose/arabinose/galactoside ABC-type transport system permease subunit
MSDEAAIQESGINYETRVLVVGSLIGALVGLAGAFLLVKNNERKGTELQVTTGEGVKLSLIIMALLRQVADL